MTRPSDEEHLEQILDQLHAEITPLHPRNDNPQIQRLAREYRMAAIQRAHAKVPVP